MELVKMELEKAGADYLFLDHRKIADCDIEFSCDIQNDVACRVILEGTSIDLDTMKVAYPRPYSFFDYPGFQGKTFDDPLVVKASCFEVQLMAWLNASDTVLINAAGPSASNNSKPYQLSVIKQAGFLVPETFVSNEPAAALEFLERSGRSVYKSVSAVRSIVNEVGEEQLQAIDDIKWCPTLFQKVVEGDNYRVHVVGEELFAARISSDKLDYRYGQTTMLSEQLPPDVAEKCFLLNKILGLHFSGIDLMRTLDDEWYCFEVNTSPGYSYFQQKTGAPISAALARFMISSDR